MKRIFLLYINLIIITFLLSTAQGYAEDIVLTDNQVMLIENTTYSQDGNIFIRDNARLTISNSTLIFNQSYHAEYAMYIEDNGMFEVIYSIIKTGILEYEAFNINVIDEAIVIFDNSDLSTPGDLYLGGGFVHLLVSGDQPQYLIPKFSLYQ